MLSDFEPPATSQPTEHGAATARELRTPVRLITLCTVDMAVSPFAQHKTLRPLETKQSKTNKQRTKTTDIGQVA